MTGPAHSAQGKGKKLVARCFVFLIISFRFELQYRSLGLSLFHVSGPLSCFPSYYRKGPRIGPNRKDQQLDSWPSLWPPGTYGEAEQGQLAHVISSPPCCISPECTVIIPRVCIQSSPDALHQLQNVKSSKTLNAFICKA